MKPVFLFSLPRSGSTLLQRMLAVHDEIETTAEPWIWIPLVYAAREKEIYAEYDHKNLVLAQKTFIENLPNKQDDYDESLREFVDSLYRKASKNSDAKYFLDKTPRYHLIIDEIVKSYPDARFVFLWRNPLEIIASIVETFCKGDWRVYYYKVDLFDGMQSLISAFKKYQERSVAVHYDNLIADTDAELQKITDYLGIDFDPQMKADFQQVKLNEFVGDPSGRKLYQEVSDAPASKWKTVLASPVRKAWCRKYLKWIGEENLKLTGYDLNDLLQQIDESPTRLAQVPKDLMLRLYGFFYCLFEPTILAKNFRRLRQWHKVHIHN